MELIHHIATSSQSHGKLMGPGLGMAEHHHQIGLLPIDDLAQLIYLIIFGSINNNLLDGLQSHLVAFDLYALRAFHILGGQRFHPVRHGSREKHELTVGGGGLQQHLHILDKAQLHHLVGFIKHQLVHPGQVNGTAAQVVKEPARGANDNLRMPSELLLLSLYILAAVNNQ